MITSKDYFIAGIRWFASEHDAKSLESIKFSIYEKHVEEVKGLIHDHTAVTIAITVSII